MGNKTKTVSESITEIEEILTFKKIFSVEVAILFWSGQFYGGAEDDFGE